MFSKLSSSFGSSSNGASAGDGPARRPHKVTATYEGLFGGPQQQQPYGGPFALALSPHTQALRHALDQMAAKTGQQQHVWAHVLCAMPALPDFMASIGSKLTHLGNMKQFVAALKKAIKSHPQWEAVLEKHVALRAPSALQHQTAFQFVATTGLMPLYVSWLFADRAPLTEVDVNMLYGLLVDGPAPAPLAASAAPFVAKAKSRAHRAPSLVPASPYPRVEPYRSTLFQGQPAAPPASFSTLFPGLVATGPVVENEEDVDPPAVTNEDEEEEDENDAGAEEGGDDDVVSNDDGATGASKEHVVAVAAEEKKDQADDGFAFASNGHQCRARTGAGHRCTRNIKEGGQHYCTQHAKLFAAPPPPRAAAPLPVRIAPRSALPPLPAAAPLAAVVDAEAGRCTALTKTGKRCSRGAKIGTMCTQHHGLIAAQ